MFSMNVSMHWAKKVFAISFAFLGEGGGLEQIACHLPIALFWLNAEC